MRLRALFLSAALLLLTLSSFKALAEVSRTLKGVAEGRDEILEKAIEVVGGS